MLLVAKCAGDHNGEPRGMPPHSAPCCRSSVATSPLAYRSGVRPDYATFHILRVLSSDADTTVLPSGANLHAQRNIREHICDGRLRLSPAERGRAAGKIVTLTVLPTAMAQNKQRYLWPFSVVRHVPNSTSQILRVLSQDADTMVLPWGAKTHAVTILLPIIEMSGNTFVRSSTPLPR